MSILVRLAVLLSATLFALFPVASIAQGLIEPGTKKIEEQMAVINAGGPVPTDHVSVNRFRFLLTALSSAADESPTSIGDKLTKSRDLIRENFGKEVGLLTLTEAAYKNRAGIKPGQFASFVTLLLIRIGTE